MIERAPGNALAVVRGTVVQTKPRSSHALIWGARGFIGAALARHLLDRQWRVRLLTRSLAEPMPDWADSLDCIALDSGDRRASFRHAVAGTDVVFNLAGSSGAVASNRNPLESLDANCRLQLEFLSACELAADPVHIVFASSRLVYAPAGIAAVSESHPLGPRSIYAAHKLCVEHYHQIAAGRGRLSATICRISNPYGLDAAAGDKSYGFVNGLIQSALAGRPVALFGDGRQLRDYIHIDDLVAMLRLSAERAAARNTVLNIGCGESLAIGEAAQRIQRVFDGGPIDSRPWPTEHAAVESGDFVMDITRARAALGCPAPITFNDGLRRVRLTHAMPAEPQRAQTAPVGTPL